MALLPLSQRLDQFKKLASDVEQGSKKAKMFKTGTRRIARFTRRISDLIAMYSELGEWSMNREKERLQVLYKAVDGSKELVSSCSQHYSIIGSLRANELKDEFSQWGESVAGALEEFAEGEEFGDAELHVEFAMEISALTEHLSGAKFVDKEMTTQCAFAESLVDSLESLSQSPNYSTITKLVDDAISDSSFDLVDFTDVEKLHAAEPEWLESTGLKEEYLALLQMMITKAMVKKRGLPSLSKDPVPEVPASFKCPISKEIMKDPVVTSGGFFSSSSSHIYDRESITNRLKNGNFACPITGRLLTNVQLISLPTLKKDIDDFVKKHAIRVPSTTVPQNGTGGGSGLTTSSIFGPVSGGLTTSNIFGPVSGGLTTSNIFSPVSGGLFSSPSGLPGVGSTNATFPPVSTWLSSPPRVTFQPTRSSTNATPADREYVMTIVSEKEFQHLDLEQLRHHDYAQRGYNGLTMEPVQSQINRLTMDEHSKNFSNGVQFPHQPASVVQPLQLSQPWFGSGGRFDSPPTFGGQNHGVSSFGQGFGGSQDPSLSRPVPGAVPQFGADAANGQSPSSTPQ